MHLQEAKIFHGRTVPTPPPNEVWRDGILSSLEAMFETGIEILFIDSPAEEGKTTLLSQAVRHFHPHCLSLFIRNLSRWSFDPDQLQADISSQAALLLERNIYGEDDFRDPQVWNYLAIQLQKEARRAGRIYYFIVDGLTTLDGVDNDAKRAILDMLPIGLPGFRFLMSGTKEQYPELLRASDVARTFTLPAFGSDEVSRLLSGLDLSKKDIEAVQKICRGRLKKLTAVRKVLQSAQDKSAAIDSLPEHLPTIFELDWKEIVARSSEDLEWLAVLAYEQSPHTVVTLSAALKRSAAEVNELIECVHFLGRVFKMECWQISSGS